MAEESLDIMKIASVEGKIDTPDEFKKVKKDLLEDTKSEGSQDDDGQA